MLPSPAGAIATAAGSTWAGVAEAATAAAGAALRGCSPGRPQGQGSTVTTSPSASAPPRAIKVWRLAWASAMVTMRAVVAAGMNGLSRCHRRRPSMTSMPYPAAAASASRPARPSVSRMPLRAPARCIADASSSTLEAPSW